MPGLSPAATPGWFQRVLQSGTGVAISIEQEHLDVMVVRVRPSAVRVLAWKRFSAVMERPAAAVGSEILQFLRELGAGHLAAHVLLPREAVIVRTIVLPGVPDKDLDRAVELQLESLHPYAEQSVSFGAVRIGKSPTVLVGLCREEFLDRWIAFFAEAGIKLAAFRISPDVFHQAVRVLRVPPGGFLACSRMEGDAVEFYGESGTCPVYSALLYNPPRHAVERAMASLRLQNDVQADAPDVLDLASLLAPPQSVSEGEVAARCLPLYAAALGAASTFPKPVVNLLPAELRKGSNWAMVLPTLVLAGLLALLAVGLLVQQNWNQRAYAERLQAEIRKWEQQVAEGQRMDAEGERLLARLELLKAFRSRTRSDLGVLQELTRVLPDTAWLNQLEITSTTVTLAGEARQAGDLLKLIDDSAMFSGSSFAMPLQRAGEAEMFRVRTNREKRP